MAHRASACGSRKKSREAFHKSESFHISSTPPYHPERCEQRRAMTGGQPIRAVLAAMAASDPAIDPVEAPAVLEAAAPGFAARAAASLRADGFVRVRLKSTDLASAMYERCAAFFDDPEAPGAAFSAARGTTHAAVGRMPSGVSQHPHSSSRPVCSRPAVRLLSRTRPRVPRAAPACRLRRRRAGQSGRPGGGSPASGR